jgi:hypothetical protein
MLSNPSSCLEETLEEQPLKKGKKAEKQQGIREVGEDKGRGGGREGKGREGEENEEEEKEHVLLVFSSTVYISLNMYFS